MAYFDVVFFVASAGGTGDFGVASAVQGYRTPAGASVPNGAVGGYRAESSNLLEWEIGVFTYSTTGPTVARTTVIANSLGTTAKINFTTAPNVGFVELSQDLTNASLLLTGTIPINRVGSSGTRNSTTFHRGDDSWTAVVDHGVVDIVFYSGSQTITIPTGATRAFVEMVAPGGGSSGNKLSGCTWSGQYMHGSSGAVLEKMLTGLTGGLTLAYTEGAAGTAGAITPTSGGDAGNSTLASGTQSISTLTCPGGKGGTTTAVGVGASVATGGDNNWGSIGANINTQVSRPSDPARGWGIVAQAAYVNTAAPASLGYGAAGIGGSNNSTGSVGRAGQPGRLKITWFY